MRKLYKLNAMTVPLLQVKFVLSYYEVVCILLMLFVGGCKHALAFLMWVHRRSEDPAPTEVTCYWKKSKLSGVGTSLKCMQVKDLSANKAPVNLPDNSTFCKDLLAFAETQQNDSQISRHFYKLECNKLTTSLSLYQLAMEYFEGGGTTAESFLDFMKLNITAQLCQEAEVATRDQSKTVLWHELRFMRITASKIYAVAHCKTPDGSLVEQLLGAAKVKDTAAIARGRALETKVLRVLEDHLGTKLKKSGLIILNNNPVFGASPDGIADDFIVEIKCPINNKSLKRYIDNNLVAPAYKAQMDLQMFAANKTKGVFCVADPNFETTNKIITVWIDLDKDNLNQLMNDSLCFWKQHVFVKIGQSIKT